MTIAVVYRGQRQDESRWVATNSTARPLLDDGPTWVVASDSEVSAIRSS